MKGSDIMNKVSINLKSVSCTVGAEPDVMEFMTEGTLSPANDDGRTGWELSYNDSELTGFTGSTTKVKCFGRDLVSMSRTGVFDQNLIIEYGKKHHCDYDTEYGRMVLGIYTHSIINRLTEDGGELYFRYTIDANGSMVSENEVLLEVSRTGYKPQGEN